MECDSVLGQQSISGKNVSLILCVWKPCYVKSGHIWTNEISSSRVNRSDAGRDEKQSSLPGLTILVHCFIKVHV